MGTAGEWCLIESDPGVFTELIKGFGCTGVQVEELYDLEDQLLDQLKPIHGLIFLFKYTSGDEPAGSLVQDSRLDSIFFASQVIQNACATQALISILLNCEHSDLTLGDELSSFKQFTAGFDAGCRGLALSNSEKIRDVHNSFSRTQMFEFDNSAAPKDDEVYHFVSYLPINGRLYELDGLRPGPIDHGALLSEENWVQTAKPVIQQRMMKYSQGEIHFNLMAVVSDRQIALEKQLAQTMETDEAGEEVEQIKEQITREQRKRTMYKKENIRRRHNFLPFIMELLKVMAKEGQLTQRVQQAVEKAEKKKEEKQKRKEAAAAK